MSAIPSSWLFTPGTRPDRFVTAASSGAQAIILDLEDAVAEPAKAEARRNILAFLEKDAAGTTRIAVRINPLGRSVGLEDLVAIARTPRAPDFIVVPKAEDPAELDLATRVLNDAGSSTMLVALIESARGVAASAAIARTRGLAALMFGAADYSADLGQQVGAFDPVFARAAVVNAAASGGVAAIDSPFFAIDKPDDLRAECQRARASGFFGKAAIHPSQIAAIDQAFTPTAEEIDLCRRILTAAPTGVGVLDGKMIDIAMMRWARRIVPAAELIERDS